jgi:HD superfamily phosphohydrolase
MKFVAINKSNYFACSVTGEGYFLIALSMSFEFTFTSFDGLFPLTQLLIQECDEVKRLARVAQLGQAPRVLGFTAHSRLEHCIGTAKLAREFARRVLMNSALSGDLEFSLDEEMAVEVAGLMHDVGHGPFSHTFEKLNIGPVGWCHEVESGRIIKRVLPAFAERVGIQEVDLFVEKVHWLVTRSGAMPGFCHPWLADIVNSHGGHLGLDMDRCDYLMRDSFYWASEEAAQVHCEAVECVNLLLKSCRVESLDAELIVLGDCTVVQRVANLRSRMFDRLYLREEVLQAERVLVERVKRSEKLGEIHCGMDDLQFMEAL